MKNKQRLHWRSIVVGLVFVLLFSTSSAHGVPTIKIGVLASRGEEKCYQMWNSTAQYLTREIPGKVFEIIALSYDALPFAVKNDKIDFVIANPSSYVELEAEYGITRIATLKNRLFSKGYSYYGGVIFTRSDRSDLNSLYALRGKKFFAVDRASFAGFQMAWREMRECGIEPDRDFASLEFCETLDSVVFAVKDGRADAGTVRTDTLERMAAEGKINLTDFRLVPTPHSLSSSDFFPFRHSTILYPEWPFARTKHASEEMSTKVAIALLQMPPDSPMASDSLSKGWTSPMDYQPVHDCMRILKIGCYKDFGKITLLAIVKNYGYWLLCILGLFLLVLKTNHRLSGSEKNLQSKIVEIEVAERKFRHLSYHNSLILNSIKEGLIGLNSSGIHTFVNSAASPLLGYPIDELLNKSSHNTWHHVTSDGEKFPPEKCPILHNIVDGVPIHDS
ncbi:MAG: PhnD/SsuA/transferrin family substrate-binding protein [Candidatus Riflebacteria bacterium]|nr:PhnD/SsuA/transferrin family substrate-binding protein [Candidatus Riflebacteria bacterium]